MSLLDTTTGGKSSDATSSAHSALEALQSVPLPTIDQLTLPELQKYAVAMNMTPAQMEAFLQQSNAYNNQNIDQTGTSAQQKALAQLADVANAGSEGSATSRAQVEQINQDNARNLAGQRGAIDQQAQARGVSPGMLQAALQSQRAGEGQQDAHMAALGAQSNAYQQALQAMAQGGALGGQLQGQQNTQANTVAAAQNAMQQFNAANQQNASANNAGFQQAANTQNTQNANQASGANTGLANERTRYNTNVPQQNFQNQMQKATGIANQYNNNAGLASQQGGQNAGLFGGLLGTAGTVIGGMYGGPAGAAAGGALGNSLGNSGSFKPMPPPASSSQYSPYGTQPQYAHGGMISGGCYEEGGMIPGEPNVQGDSAQNDFVDITVSPGEAVIPRSSVQQNPMDVMKLISGQPGDSMSGNVDPQDVATLLKAMKMMRGAI